MSRPHDTAADQPTLVDAELTPAEVVELWAFVHGDIMEGPIRQLLRAGVGLCPRHTWGYAAAEIELWQTGAGVRGGHQPFDVSVLYEDLLGQVAARLRKPGLFCHDLRHVLIPQQECRNLRLDETGRHLRPEFRADRLRRLDRREPRPRNQPADPTEAWCRETWPVLARQRYLSVRMPTESSSFLRILRALTAKRPPMFLRIVTAKNRPCDGDYPEVLAGATDSLSVWHQRTRSEEGGSG